MCVTTYMYEQTWYHGMQSINCVPRYNDNGQHNFYTYILLYVIYMFFVVSVYERYRCILRKGTNYVTERVQALYNVYTITGDM